MYDWGRGTRGLAIGFAISAALLAGCDGASDGASDATATPATAMTTEATSAPGGASTPATAADSQSTVSVSGFLFRPKVIEVPAGTTVTWENSDQILHTATAGEPGSPSGLFDGQMDGAGTSFSHTFDDPGTFAFFCSRHLQMRGEVIVR